MIFYLALLLVPLLLSLQQPRKRASLPGVAAFCVVIAVFIGLRDEIGPDWRGYLYILERTQEKDWSEVWNEREPLFFLLNKASDALGWGLYGVNTVCAGLFMHGVYRYAKVTVNPWLAIGAVTPFLIFIIAMSGVRQAAAVGILMGLASAWSATSLWKKLLMIALAMGLHNSALFMLVFVVWDTGRYQWMRIAIGGLLGIIALRYLGDSGATEVYAKRYLQENVRSDGALYHVLLCSIPGFLYLVFRRQILAHLLADGLVARASILSIALLPMVFLSSTGTSRVSLYLSFVQMWVFPAFVAAHGRRWQGATIMCCAYFLAVFVIYFSMGTHVSAYIPYRSILWTGWG